MNKKTARQIEAMKQQTVGARVETKRITNEKATCPDGELCLNNRLWRVYRDIPKNWRPLKWGVQCAPCGYTMIYNGEPMFVWDGNRYHKNPNRELGLCQQYGVKNYDSAGRLKG